MFCQSRNKQLIWYALRTGETEYKDTNGNSPGLATQNYSAPVAMYANVRWNSGAVELTAFGINQSGTRRIVTDDMSCPITDSTILWIGITPDANGESGTVKHNYVVAGAPERSLNQIAYTVAEVNVS